MIDVIEKVLNYSLGYSYFLIIIAVIPLRIYDEAAKRKINPRILEILFTLYIITLLFATNRDLAYNLISLNFGAIRDSIYVIPNELNYIPFQTINDIKDMLSENVFSVKSIWAYALRNILGNIVSFVPYSVILIMLKRDAVWKIITSGIGLSVAIEALQLLSSRRTDIDDVILNTLGVCIGVLISEIISNWRKRRAKKRAAATVQMRREIK